MVKKEGVGRAGDDLTGWLGILGGRNMQTRAGRGWQGSALDKQISGILRTFATALRRDQSSESVWEH